tara:strand:+ start:137 stop:1567 length:1431 start_codon:yes stop_codon:yes gene_type:complete
VSNTSPIIVWLRHDLRLADNPALHAASKLGAVVPVFVLASEEEDLPPGGASKWWLHQSLKSLGRQFNALGSPLIIRQGESIGELQQVAKETGATAIYWNRSFNPKIASRDAAMVENLRTSGFKTQSFRANLLLDPRAIETQQGRPYTVFTPFWKACLKQLNPPSPLPIPTSLIRPDKQPDTLDLHELQLEHQVDWTVGMRRAWAPGTSGANLNLKLFTRYALQEYDHQRDLPGVVGTSRLSPHLHFGEISPQQVWHAIAESGAAEWKHSQFITELGWREFAQHLLHHFPHTINEPLRAPFNRFPWQKNADHLQAWQKGCTGYPLVDAGMRELWASGWMHNRMRMVAGSFLVKHLRIDWREGANWFWDTLVDADLASNTLGWQWISGCGADAAPYFRIFNPVIQGEKFDPHGDYVRRWIPELKKLPPKWIHKPWTAPSIVLQDSRVRLGENYPMPIVDHKEARNAALDALKSIRQPA